MSDVKFYGLTNKHNLPLSKAAVAGDFFFTFGDGEHFDPKAPKPAMRRLFKRLAKLLRARGLDFTDVAKTTVLLSPIGAFKDYSAVYAEFFRKPYPCRTTIPVTCDTPFVEIDVVAYKKGLSDAARAPKARPRARRRAR
jgi:enamine deaminase RidA (YjgF/YER057c/UK114 family)